MYLLATIIVSKCAGLVQRNLILLFNEISLLIFLESILGRKMINCIQEPLFDELILILSPVFSRLEMRMEMPLQWAFLSNPSTLSWSASSNRFSLFLSVEDFSKKEISNVLANVRKKSQNAVKNSVKIQQEFSQNAVKILSKFSQNAIKMQQNSIKMQLKCSQNSSNSWSAHRLKSFQSCLAIYCPFHVDLNVSQVTPDSYFNVYKWTKNG